MEDDKLVCQEYCVQSKIIEELKKDELSEEVITQLADVFKILGDPTRIKIIHTLAKQELCVCDISELLRMSQSAISHQLRKLREFKLVKYRREGRVVYYSLDDDHVLQLFSQGLEHVKEGK
ncbi:metalloregulator ArsR/SmtB family transcription factor [Natroniella acetigena]|uniref:ArsR/SmtB family transcription factor n=1 Tax=Natroniella acetigena TaxID=52004 RepID=UPI00200AA7BE|nr:metalloregulator ArsR/SmtB family transcription factor [Natroniella acetigena]MCK8828435.1 metalloregulator ArsR/SmtB family transcription factor [Natroniella acetigena]